MFLLTSVFPPEKAPETAAGGAESVCFIKKDKIMTIGLLTTPEELKSHLKQTRVRKTPLPQKVLMVHPHFFDVKNVINVHMRDEFGAPHRVSREVAESQWLNLKKTYENLGITVHTLDVQADLPDIVFCANQTLPFLDPWGRKTVVLSVMRSEFRRPEVEYFQSYFLQQEYDVITGSKPGLCFEGMGDLLPLPSRRLLLAGYGPRTDYDSLEWLAEVTGLEVVPLELPNEKFYHLDTCLSILDQKTALACREGFSDEGWSLLTEIFDSLLLADVREADAPGFAVNCHCPNQRDVIIQKGNVHTVELLQQHGFVVHEIDTSEFIKAGGSVFCMKLMFY